MKTRIKETKYGDGNLTYKVQTFRNHRSFFKDMKVDFCKNPIAVIVFSPCYYIYSFFLLFFWETHQEYSILKNAQKHIDDIYEKINIEKEKKEKQKLAKKVVSKTYIKYP